MTKATNEPLDLAQFDSVIERQNEGILVPIKGMDGKTSLGFSIRVAGPDSDRAQRAQEEMANEMIANEDLTTIDARVASERGMRYLAKVTMDFVPHKREDGSTPDHAIILDKAPLPYSEDNAFKLYTRFRFIFDQVNRAAGNRARFTKG